MLHLSSMRGMPSAAGFPQVRTCPHAGTLAHFATLEGDLVPTDHQSCWTIENIFPIAMDKWADRSVKMDPLERAEAGDLAAKGVPLPQDMIEARFDRSNKTSMVEMLVMFNPEGDGITSSQATSVLESDWTITNVKRSPEKQAFVGKIRAWAETFWPRFKQAYEQGANIAP